MYIFLLVVLVIILLPIVAYLRLPKCKKCGSAKLKYSHWRRGSNTLGGGAQGVGAMGTRCYDCGNIVWDIPDEIEWLNGEPHWIQGLETGLMGTSTRWN